LIYTKTNDIEFITTGIVTRDVNDKSQGYVIGLDTASENSEGTIIKQSDWYKPEFVGGTCSCDELKKYIKTTLENNLMRRVCTKCGQRIGKALHICNPKYVEEYQKEVTVILSEHFGSDCMKTTEETIDMKSQDDIDCEYTDEVVCPHCGYKYECSYEMFPGQDTETTEKCIECNKEFIANSETEVTYTTYKK
jgi:DNA-directed RNA polymerase subunit RPC12/RpoP